MDSNKKNNRIKHKHFFKVVELHPFTRVCTVIGCFRKEIYDYEKDNYQVTRRKS